MATRPQKRRNSAPERKVAILRQHLLDHAAVSDLRDQHQFRPNQFYDWQKRFFLWPQRRTARWTASASSRC